MSVTESTAEASRLSEFVAIPAPILSVTSVAATPTETAAALVRRFAWPPSCSIVLSIVARDYIASCFLALASCSILAEMAATPPEPNTTGDRMRVIVVEADPDLREKVTSALTTRGHSVTPVDSVQEAARWIDAG